MLTDELMNLQTFKAATMAEALNVLLMQVPPDMNTRMAARALARWKGEGGRVLRDVIPRQN